MNRGMKIKAEKNRNRFHGQKAGRSILARIMAVVMIITMIPYEPLMIYAGENPAIVQEAGTEAAAPRAEEPAPQTEEPAPQTEAPAPQTEEPAPQTETVGKG